MEDKPLVAVAVVLTLDEVRSVLSSISLAEQEYGFDEKYSLEHRVKTKFLEAEEFLEAQQ